MVQLGSYSQGFRVKKLPGVTKGEGKETGLSPGGQEVEANTCLWFCLPKNKVDKCKS